MTHCPCGLPLHYATPEAAEYMDRMVAELGERIAVEVLTRGTFLVPRHFIALHGLKAEDLPALAEIYGFERVSG